MPTAEFYWREYRVRVPVGGPLFAAEAEAPGTVAADEPTETVRLPKLGAWQAPVDKARILLESAAEIEHALMVRYLYTAYSLPRRQTWGCMPSPSAHASPR